MKIITIMVLASTVILTACGGGGLSIPAMPITPTLSAPAPTPVSRTAIETIVRAATGTNDPYYRPTCVPGAGGAGCYTNSGNNVANVLQDDVAVYSQGVTAFHRRIKGPRANAPSLVVPNPPLDVRQAWFDGWTGKGANILIMDDFLAFGLVASPTNQKDPRGIHGYSVGMSARQIAPNADFYGLEAAISASDNVLYSDVLTTYRQGGLRHANEITNVEITGAIPKIHVVNQSFVGQPINPDITREELEADFNDLSNNPRFQDVAGTAGTPLSRALADAVITKAAGNNQGADSAFIIDNVRLASTRTPNTRNRVLIVGALKEFARASTTGEHSSVSSRTSIARYSNVAGQFVPMQDRFLVEYGGSPYTESAYSCDASSTSSCNNRQVVTENVLTDFGTSYAAPRVAGFAALVRGKFPNLSGEQTAKILLDTATTTGLVCHTGSARKSADCPKNIYGQGHVDIADALSPIGKLN